MRDQVYPSIWGNKDYGSTVKLASDGQRSKHICLGYFLETNLTSLKNQLNAYTFYTPPYGFAALCLPPNQMSGAPEIVLNELAISAPERPVSPVDITGAGDGSDRLFIVNKSGTIQIFDQRARVNFFRSFS